MLELAKPSPEDLPDSQKQLKAAEASIWRNRPFTIVFTSYGISLLGNTFHSIALNLWVLQTTGSAKLMSSVFITQLVVVMLFGSVAGTIADRVDRRTLMWATDLIRFVLVGGIALMMYLPGSPFIVIIVLTGLVSLASAFRTPAFQASLINLVGKEHVTKAVGIMTITDNFIRIGGFALGGIAVAAFGGVFAIAIDSVAFLLSAVLIFLAGQFPYPMHEKEENEGKASFKEDFASGFRYIWNNTFVRSIILLLPIAIFFFTSTFMLIQVMAVQVWKATPFLFGLLEACIPLGYVIGSFLIIRLDNRMKKKGLWIMGSLLAMGPLFIIIAQAASALVALPFILLVGFLFSFSTTMVFVILRLAIEPAMQGRVFGLLGSLTSVAPPIGLAVFSILSDLYGPSLIITISGTLMLIIVGASYTSMKSIRSYD